MNGKILMPVGKGTRGNPSCPTKAKSAFILIREVFHETWSLHEDRDGRSFSGFTIECLFVRSKISEGGYSSTRQQRRRCGSKQRIRSRDELRSDRPHDIGNRFLDGATGPI